MTPIIFPEQRHWLSNAYPVQVWLDGVPYPTVDHAYQASKSDNLDTRLWIRAARIMREVWWRGRTVKLPAEWGLQRGDIMRKLLQQKFGDHPTLTQRLLATGQETPLLYAAHRIPDCFWGTWEGLGHNMLGMLLMELRWQLQRGVEWDAWRFRTDGAAPPPVPRHRERQARDPLATGGRR